MERDVQGRQLYGVDVLHFVHEECGADSQADSGLAELGEELRQVYDQVSGVSSPSCGLHIDSEGVRARRVDLDAEGAEHPKHVLERRQVETAGRRPERSVQPLCDQWRQRLTRRGLNLRGDPSPR